jgi:hypothetical protein
MMNKILTNLLRVPLNRQEALWLLTEADLLAVGKLAGGIRRRSTRTAG